MRTILTVEQAKQVAADIEAWKNQHATDSTPILPDDSAETIAARNLRWQKAKLVEFDQLTEINEIECYFVRLQFPDHVMSYVLKRNSDGTLHQVYCYSFLAPGFTHIAQERTH